MRAVWYNFGIDKSMYTNRLFAFIYYHDMCALPTPQNDHTYNLDDCARGCVTHAQCAPSYTNERHVWEMCMWTFIHKFRVWVVQLLYQFSVCTTHIYIYIHILWGTGARVRVRRFHDNNNEEIWAVNYRFLYAHTLARKYVCEHKGRGRSVNKWCNIIITSTFRFYRSRKTRTRDFSATKNFSAETGRSQPQCFTPLQGIFMRNLRAVVCGRSQRRPKYCQNSCTQL